jgi:hypothetical protein
LADVEKLLREEEFLKLSYYVPNILNLKGYEAARPEDEAASGGMTAFDCLKRGYLEYLGLVVEHTIKDEVWKKVVKDAPGKGTLEKVLTHLETSEEIVWGDYSGSLVEFDVYVKVAPPYFEPMDAFTKTMTIEGIRNVVFGLQIASAVAGLPSKKELILLGSIPSTTSVHYEAKETRDEHDASRGGSGG